MEDNEHVKVERYLANIAKMLATPSEEFGTNQFRTYSKFIASKTLNTICDLFDFKLVNRLYTAPTLRRQDLQLLVHLLKGYQYFLTLRDIIISEQPKSENDDVDEIMKYEFVTQFYHEDGNNLLTLAATHNHLEAVHTLLKIGANVDAKNSLGFTAIELTTDNDITQLLEAFGAKRILWEKSQQQQESLIWEPLDINEARMLETLSQGGALINELQDLAKNFNFVNFTTKSNPVSYIRKKGYMESYKNVNIIWEHFESGTWKEFNENQCEDIAKGKFTKIITLQHQGGTVDLNHFTLKKNNLEYPIRWRPLANTFAKRANVPFEVQSKIAKPLSQIYMTPSMPRQYIQSLSPYSPAEVASSNNHILFKLFNAENISSTMIPDLPVLSSFLIDSTILPAFTYGQLPLPLSTPVIIYCWKNDAGQNEITIQSTNEDAIDLLRKISNNFNLLNYALGSLFHSVIGNMEKMLNTIYSVPVRQGNVELWKIFQDILKQRFISFCKDYLHENKQKLTHYIMENLDYFLLKSPIENEMKDCLMNAIEFTDDACETYCGNKLRAFTSECYQEAIGEQLKAMRNSKRDNEIDTIIKNLVGSIVKQLNIDFNKLSHFTSISEVFIKLCKGNYTILKYASQIADCFLEPRVVLLQGQPGIGKSICLAPLLYATHSDWSILITQPSRLQCKLIYQQISKLVPASRVKCSLFAQVKTPEPPPGGGTFIEVVTEEVLKDRLLRLPDWSIPDVVILDEAHEKTTNMDLAIALLLRRDLNCKLLISSAEIPSNLETLFTIHDIPFSTLNLDAVAPFEVESKEIAKCNPVQLAYQYVQTLKRDEQILCFLSSKHGTIVLSFPIGYFI